MDKALLQIIAKLLNYSFEPVFWKIDYLTAEEVAIVGDQVTLDKLKAFSEEHTENKIT